MIIKIQPMELFVECYWILLVSHKKKKKKIDCSFKCQLHVLLYIDCMLLTILSFQSKSYM